MMMRLNWYKGSLFMSYFIVGLFCFIVGMGVATHLDRKAVEAAYSITTTSCDADDNVFTLVPGEFCKPGVTYQCVEQNHWPTMSEQLGYGHDWEGRR
jgi:hypothetical protein